MRRRFLLGLVLAAVAGAALAVAAASTPRPLAIQGLLVHSFGYPTQTVRLVTLTGRELPVPPRVRRSPFGLSPDARLVAVVDAPPKLRGPGAVLLGPVRGGSLHAVFQADCGSPPCPLGADPSFAWSPDGQQLAVAGNPARGATILRLVDRRGTVIRSFVLPSQNSERHDRAYHHLVAWSPDGSHLLLRRDDDFGPVAAVALDLATGRLRTLAEFRPCDTPTLAWSPDSRYVALATAGTQDCDDRFAIVDAGSGRSLLQRTWPKGLGQGGTVWAPDSRSVFAAPRRVTSSNGKVASRIDRVSLGGRHSTIVRLRAGQLIPRIALSDRLVYQVSSYSGGSVVYLHRLSTHNPDRRLVVQKLVDSVVPLARLP